jgi:hypothetical protein
LKSLDHKVILAIAMVRPLAILAQAVTFAAALPQGKGGSGLGGLFGDIGGIIGNMGGQSTWDDFLKGDDCKDVIMVIARGSMEPGNVVSVFSIYT